MVSRANIRVKRRQFKLTRRRLSRMRVQPTEPSAAITAKYSLALRRFTSKMVETMEAEIKRRFEGYRPAGVTDAEVDPRQALQATFAFAETLFDRFEDTAAAVAGQAVVAGEAFNRQQFVATIKQGIGIDIKAVVDQQNLGPVLRRRIRKNVDLIKSIPEKYAAQIQKTLSAGIDQGKDFESLFTTIKELGEVSDRRAKFIARDQMSKLNADLSQARQRALGVDSYIWRTAKDARVGDDHKPHEGKVFRWDSPPKTGHPGHRPNCRCVAEPNIRAALGMSRAA